jgi:hypothetical protein
MTMVKVLSVPGDVVLPALILQHITTVGIQLHVQRRLVVRHIKRHPQQHGRHISSTCPSQSNLLQHNSELQGGQLHAPVQGLCHNGAVDSQLGGQGDVGVVDVATGWVHLQVESTVHQALQGGNKRNNT